MRYYWTLALAAAVSLPACSVWNNLTRREYDPEYLKEDSPLDPPGVRQAREAARAKLVKEGKFAAGAVVEVQEGRAALFDHNPERDPDANSKMVTMKNATIIACEGLYYFVKAEGGQKGFLRESDFVQPESRLVDTGLVMPGGVVTPGAPGGVVAEGDLLPGDPGIPEEEVQLAPNETLDTTAANRTVVVREKKTDKGREFEERRKAMMQTEAPAGEEAGDELPTPAAELGQ